MKLPLKTRFLHFTPTLLFATAALLVWGLVSDLEARRMQALFENEVRQMASLLEQQRRLNSEILYGLKSLFESSDEVTPGEFFTASQSALQRHRDVRAVAWAPRAPADIRQWLVTERRETYPKFEFRQLNAEGALSDAASRPLHYPIYYLEPLQGNRRAFGFDLMSLPPAERAIDAALHSRKIAFTAPIKLLQEPTGGYGYLALLPVYRAGEANDIGLIVGMYRIKDLVEESLGESLARGYRVVLHDTGKPPTPLYPTEEQGDRNQAFSDLVLRQPLSLGQRQWLLEVSPSLEAFNTQRSHLPAITAFAGVIITLLVLLLNGFLVYRARQVEHLVEKKTHDLSMANKRLEQLSLTDALTGIANRRCLEDVFKKEVRLCHRHGDSLAILVVDIDHFKHFNDEFGHAAGDNCLIRVARALSDSAHRPRDVVARTGGEEFALLLPGTDTSAEQVAERCREAVEALGIPHATSAGQPVITISIGFCYTRACNQTPIDELYKAADDALYRAKKAGRNQVVGGPFSGDTSQ